MSDIPAQLVSRSEVGELSISLGERAESFETVRDFDFTVTPSELVCILGPSGCGKGTLLGALGEICRRREGG
ncbi:MULTISPECIES: ATP-binding cassette domain-containing protein [unclassified Bradyrhizobium]|uniref:ATP-binding cassette domain-containing protein n=1 Tax=Bradyrhizobium sp. USDA 4541 TaxID=2817704 RepID=UPI0035C743A8